MTSHRQTVALVAFALVSAVACGVTDVPRDTNGSGPTASTSQALTGLPDLIVDAQRISDSFDTRVQNFTAKNCAYVEGCVSGTGKRTLLRFDVGTPNIGTADMVVGPPASNPDAFEFSACHGHYHLKDYAQYELLSADGGQVVVVGGKQAFCLLDMYRYNADAGVSHGYSCGDQGITVGWADLYYKGLDCQWLDVTDVPNGQYQLRVSINTQRVLGESNYANNSVTVPVALTGKQNGRGVHAVP